MEHFFSLARILNLAPLYKNLCQHLGLRGLEVDPVDFSGWGFRWRDWIQSSEKLTTIHHNQNLLWFSILFKPLSSFLSYLVLIGRAFKNEIGEGSNKSKINEINLERMEATWRGWSAYAKFSIKAIPENSSSLCQMLGLCGSQEEKEGPDERFWQGALVGWAEPISPTWADPREDQVIQMLVRKTIVPEPLGYS